MRRRVGSTHRCPAVGDAEGALALRKAPRRGIPRWKSKLPRFASGLRSPGIIGSSPCGSSVTRRAATALPWGAFPAQRRSASFRMTHVCRPIHGKGNLVEHRAEIQHRRDATRSGVRDVVLGFQPSCHCSRTPDCLAPAVMIQNTARLSLYLSMRRRAHRRRCCSYSFIPAGNSRDRRGAGRA